MDPIANSDTNNCPLCNGLVSLFYRDKNRDYYLCETCDLVSVPPHFFFSAEDEKRHYDQHENSPEDLRYRRFLSRLFEPMSKHISSGSRGLDFGSGPGPTLSVMFEEAGHQMAIYDHYYAKDPEVFNHCYDFITSSEVVEHLHRPGEELDRLWSILKPGGFLGIMTKRVRGKADFPTWHYKQEPTHICFFSEDTFHWLADRWSASVEFPAADVAIFRKSDGLPP